MTGTVTERAVVFRARYYGLCGECGGAILPGSYVVLDKTVVPFLGRIHVACYNKTRRAAA